MKDPTEISVVIGRDVEPDRLDRLVAHLGKVSRREARLFIAQGAAFVDGKEARIYSRDVRAGALFTLKLTMSVTAKAAPALRQDPRILYCDRYLVVVDKPAGLLSERDRFGSPAVESVLPGILRRLGERHDEVRLVHRLDAGTSGVLVLARTPMAATVLGNAFASHLTKKSYLALCVGLLRRGRTIDAPIGRQQGTRHAVDLSGKPASTHVEPLATSDGTSLVLAEPKTGRTHQIRVHLSHIGHPLLGDRLYGGPGYTAETPPAPIARPMLHAARLWLPHPKTGEALVVRVPPPEDFEMLARSLSVWTDLTELCGRR